MMRFARPHLAGLLILLVSVAGGCVSVQMAIPQDLSEVSDETPITDRHPSARNGNGNDESFVMGPYQVLRVSRNGFRPMHTGLSTHPSAAVVRAIVFDFKGSAGFAYGGQCTLWRDERQQESGLECACTGDRNAFLDLDPSAQSRGTMTTRDQRYSVETVYKQQDGSTNWMWKPIGYQVRGWQMPIGAVEVIGGGRFWLNRALAPTERADVACIFAGLLLQDEQAH